jgi:hypothetical protein
VAGARGWRGAHAVISATILPALLADPSTNALVNDDSVLFANLMAGPFGVMMGLAVWLLLVGVLATAAAVVHSRALPRWPAVVLVLAVLVSALGMLVPVVPGMLGPTGLFVGLVGLGTDGQGLVRAIRGALRLHTLDQAHDVGRRM